MILCCYEYSNQCQCHHCYVGNFQMLPLGSFLILLEFFSSSASANHELVAVVKIFGTLIDSTALPVAHIVLFVRVHIISKQIRKMTVAQHILQLLNAFIKQSM